MTWSFILPVQTPEMAILTRQWLFLSRERCAKVPPLSRSGLFEVLAKDMKLQWSWRKRWGSGKPEDTVLENFHL
jgi:hypothetical protein